MMASGSPEPCGPWSANTVRESRPGARCWHCCRPVSPGRSPNPPCASRRNGLSTVALLSGLGPWGGDRASVAVAGDAYLLEVEQSDPVGADRFPPASVVGQVPAQCGPPPAVPGLQPPRDPPPEKLVQVPQGVRADGVPEVGRPAAQD